MHHVSAAAQLRRGRLQEILRENPFERGQGGLQPRIPGRDLTDLPGSILPRIRRRHLAEQRACKAYVDQVRQAAAGVCVRHRGHFAELFARLRHIDKLPAILLAQPENHRQDAHQSAVAAGLRALVAALPGFPLRLPDVFPDRPHAGAADVEHLAVSCKFRTVHPGRKVVCQQFVIGFRTALRQGVDQSEGHARVV